MSCQMVCMPCTSTSETIRHEIKFEETLHTNVAAAHKSLSQPYAVVGVPLRHVGKNHFVAHAQPRNNLDRVHRAASQLHIYARSFRSVRVQFENTNRAVRLSVHRAAHIEHVL